MTTTSLPKTQQAVQLIGPSQLRRNTDKPVPQPGPYEILARIEAVGLCFSDLKLLKQFDKHPRKNAIVKGLSPEVLAGIQSYVPGGEPSVPGHEAVCRIVAVGAEVKHHNVGERCLIQTDYRDLITPGSNAAFGYNFEGGLQEYVIMDERVVLDGKGQRFLIPVGEEKSASAVALVEPWACVEDSYVTRERRTIKAGGRLLIVVDPGCGVAGVAGGFSPQGKPAEVVCVCHDEAACKAVAALGLPKTDPRSVTELKDESFDDIIYFGSDKATLEVLSDKLGVRGIINIVLAGKRIGAPVSIGVGRIHYGMTRWIGTTGQDASVSYRIMSDTGEIREGDQVMVIGAGGPMGQMHVIRNICAGVKGVNIVGTDFDDPRLEALNRKARRLAEINRVGLRLVNPEKEKLTEAFTYYALMAPLAPLVADAVKTSADDAIVNIFAGIPAPTKHEIDLDLLIQKRCFLFGTSGSTIEDMKIVLGKLEDGRLNTNCSIDAVSGMAGAIKGIEAVEHRTLAGKIIVYPMLHDLDLTPLPELKAQFPSVAAKLEDGEWTRAAEEELLRVAR